MGYNAQALVRKLPREIKLTANSRRLLDYLAFRANEDDFKQTGLYACWPSEEQILEDLGFSSATLYRSLDELEYRCRFYLITRRDAKKRWSTLYDLHILPHELKPDAITDRQQAADARLSATRGMRGARKRNTSQVGTCLPGITSQNERCLPEITSQNETNHLSKREVITSQNERCLTQITSQNERQNKEEDIEQGILNKELYNLSSSKISATNDDDVSKNNRPETRTKDGYAEQVRGFFNALPLSQKKARLTQPERQLCSEWHKRQIHPAIVETALWEGIARNIAEPGDSPPHIHSLKYFADIVEELIPKIGLMGHISERNVALAYLENLRQQVQLALQSRDFDDYMAKRASRAKAATGRGP